MSPPEELNIDNIYNIYLIFTTCAVAAFSMLVIALYTEGSFTHRMGFFNSFRSKEGKEKKKQAEQKQIQEPLPSSKV